MKDLCSGTWNLLKFNQLYISWKTLQTSFWNSNGLPRLISSGKLSHGKHWNTSTRNLCRSSTLVEKICRWYFCDHEKSKLSEFLTHLNTIESSIQFTMEKEKEGCLPFLNLLSVCQLATYSWQYIVSQPIPIDTSTLDQNTLYSINNQSLTPSSNKLKYFPPQPGTGTANWNMWNKLFCWMVTRNGWLTLWRPLGFQDFREKKRLNARAFVWEFLWSGMLYRPSKSLKRRGKSSSLHSQKYFLLGECGFLWVTS